MKLRDMMTDTKKGREGVWIGKKFGTPIDGFGDLCLRVKSMDTAEFRRLQAAKVQALSKDDREVDGTVKLEVSDRIYRECLDEAILLDWQFLLDDDGGEVEHSPELQTVILMHNDAEKFRNAVFRASGIVANIQGSTESILTKNSSKPSKAK